MRIGDWSSDVCSSDQGCALLSGRTALLPPPRRRSCDGPPCSLGDLLAGLQVQALAAHRDQAAQILARGREAHHVLDAYRREAARAQVVPDAAPLRRGRGRRGTPDEPLVVRVPAPEIEPALRVGVRSGERRVGKEWVRKGRIWW